MKLWRKMARNGNGRMIKQMTQMQEMIMKGQPKPMPGLLIKMFDRAGIKNEVKFDESV